MDEKTRDPSLPAKQALADNIQSAANNSLRAVELLEQRSEQPMDEDPLAREMGRLVDLLEIDISLINQKLDLIMSAQGIDLDSET